jgi:hypothetical protein
MDLVFDIETDDLKATKTLFSCSRWRSGKIYKFPPDKLDKKVMSCYLMQIL